MPIKPVMPVKPGEPRRAARNFKFRGASGVRPEKLLLLQGRTTVKRQPAPEGPEDWLSVPKGIAFGVLLAAPLWCLAVVIGVCLLR